VLEALATGLSSAEAAARLSLGLQDVRDCLKQAMAGLGARTKLEALVIAIRTGLIDPPPF
jgi:DNA-binding NarL/FixJ family response regulator